MELPISVAGKTFKVNIETRGERGPALLMVHGIPTNARLWRNVQAFLEGQYKTFAMDMLGYGKSDMPLDDFRHTLTNQAEVIREVIVQLGLKGEVILVGHDHGGGACQILASKYCDHIARLVLIDPVVFDEWPVLEVQAFNDLVGANDETLVAAMKSAVATLPGLLRTGSFEKKAFTDKNIKENYLGFWARGPRLTGFKSLVKVCAEPTNKETMSVDHSRITCPTLVCWAEHDAWMPVEAGRRLKKVIGGPVRFEVIERAGHYVQEDRPDVVAAYIDDFVTEWAKVKI